MNTPRRIFNARDIDRIRGFLELATRNQGGPKFKTLATLSQELATSTIVEPQEMPEDVVTMCSRVLLEYPASEEKEEFELVYPADADYSQRRVSLLAPLGAALLGQKTGTMVEYPAPAGVLQVRILDVLYQPEAAGDFDA
jgi:regulator of nucleoside diphosphate kinase